MESLLYKGVASLVSILIAILSQRGSSVVAPEISTGVVSVTRPDQFIMMPKVEFSKYSINILHLIKFIFKSVKSYKHDMHEKYA